LHEKYLLAKEEADLIASFLNPMLRLHPEKRAKAGEMNHHAWLDGITVQGELDVIRRAEEEEQKKHEASESEDTEELPSATDAMKPVDENGGTGEPSGPKQATNASLKENAPAPANSHPPVTLHSPRPPPLKRSS